MSVNPIKIIFIVPTYNRLEILRKTIEINKTICARYDASIIIIDNASQDDTYSHIKSSHPDIRIIKNDVNIGLKGSFKRALTEIANSETLLIFLSDEDIIFEPGLHELKKCLKQEKFSISENVLIFNHINRYGKDFWARRKVKEIKSWTDVEILSFGLISGFGFFLSQNLIDKIDWSIVQDTRNTYPHWIYPFDRKNYIKTLGITISATFEESNFTYLDEEWKSKKSHFSTSGVVDYLNYHKELHNSFDAKIFRIRYAALGKILNKESRIISKIFPAFIFAFSSPIQFFSYLIRFF